jgi:hypothetical protein
MSLQQSKCRRGSHCHDVVLLVLWLHWFIVPVYRLNFSPLFFFLKKKVLFIKGTGVFRTRLKNMGFIYLWFFLQNSMKKLFSEILKIV